jgi:hypothetical protein
MNFGDVEPWGLISRSSFPGWVEDAALFELEKVFDFWGIDALGEIDVSAAPPWFAEKNLFFKQYLNLFTNEDMKYCWDRAQKFEFESPISGQQWLAAALWDAFPHPRSHPATAGEADDWREKLLKSLRISRDAAIATPENMMRWDYLSNENIADECRGTISRGAIHACLPNPPDILDAYIHALEQVKYEPLNYGKHINARTAPRMHFVRSLTSALYSDVGQPLRRFVALAASVAFDCRMNERDVIRVCEGLSIESANRGTTLEGLMRKGDGIF